MLVPVATPRSAQPTLACAAINEGVATRPMPIPVTKQVIATAATDGVRARSANPAVPTTTRPSPMRIVGRKPSRM